MTQVKIRKKTKIDPPYYTAYTTAVSVRGLQIGELKQMGLGRIRQSPKNKAWYMLRWRIGADCINSRNNRVSEGLDNPLKTKPDICSGGEVYQIALIKLKQ